MVAGWLGRAELGWAALGWPGLSWAGRVHVGQGWAGLAWVGLGWAGLALAGWLAFWLAVGMDLHVGKTSLGHLVGNGLRRPLFVQICTLAGPPWATCWEMASGGHFPYTFARWQDLSGPPAGKWPPKATLRIDLHGGGASLPRQLVKWPAGATFHTDLHVGETSLDHLL